MKVKFKQQYISISSFDSIELNDFSILTGKNGSGKTHFLNAIKNGSIEIDGVDKSEIVYYNYNDFTVFTGNPQQNPLFQNRLNTWNNEKKQFFQKIQEYKNKAIQFNAHNNTPVDQTILNFIQQPNFNYDQYFGNKKDFELIESCKAEPNILNAIRVKQKEFTPQFFQFANQYFNGANGSTLDFTYELLKQKFDKVLDSKINQIVTNIIRQPNFDFDQYFGNEKDFELLENCKADSNISNVIRVKQKEFTPHFFQFANQFVANAKGKIDEFTYEELKQRFINVKDQIVSQIIISIIQQPNFDFDQYFGNEKDFELLEDCKADSNISNAIRVKQKEFTPQFFQFVNQFVSNANGGIDELTYDNLKQQFIKVQDSIDKYLGEEDEGLYRFLKSTVQNKSIFNLNANDFESPNLFIEDIANEEKEYQLKKTQNSLNKIQATDYRHNVAFLEADEFILQNGLSPVEQINNVLSEYDCNGYFLYSNSNQQFLGVDKNNIKIQISLIHNEKNYTTTFDQLSSGEKTLIALSLFIYKTRKNRIIPRVLLLDEVDSSLHPSMINRLLGVLENLFIKEQGFKVIMATHSPTTIALSPENSIYIIEKNGVQKIKKELKSNAIDILTEGIATINDEDTHVGINYNITQTELPVLFTEGITDKIILETAWEKLYETELPFFIQDCFDASFLGNLFRRAEDAQDGIFSNYPDKTFIAMFDFDQEGYNVWNGLKKKYTVIEEDPIKCLTIKHKIKSAYAILLPVPENESIIKQVVKSGKETYKNESILPIELLFYGVESLNQYFKKEQIKGGGEIVEFKGKKRDFAVSIGNLNKEDFKNVIPIFTKINEIISTNAQSSRWPVS